MMKKCNFCNKETRKSRNDFTNIDWIAIQFGKDKMLCACYEHHQEILDLIKNKFVKKTI